MEHYVQTLRVIYLQQHSFAQTWSRNHLHAQTENINLAFIFTHLLLTP